MTKPTGRSIEIKTPEYRREFSAANLAKNAKERKFRRDTLLINARKFEEVTMGSKNRMSQMSVVDGIRSEQFMKKLNSFDRSWGGL